MPKTISAVTVRLVREPAKMRAAECSPPGSSKCKSPTGLRLFRWERLANGKLIDTTDCTGFLTNKERKFVEDWIVQLIEREIGDASEPSEKNGRFRVLIDALTAESITEALIRKERASRGSNPPSP